MNIPHIILWVLLLIVLTAYVICVIHIRGNRKELKDTSHWEVSSLEKEKKDNYIRSIKGIVKNISNLMGFLLIGATLILALFDSQYYVLTSMFTTSGAAAHFYFGRRGAR